MPLSAPSRLLLHLSCVLGLAACASHKSQGDSASADKKGQKEARGGLKYQGDYAVADKSLKNIKSEKMSFLDGKVYNASKAFSDPTTKAFKAKDISTDKTYHSGHDEFKAKNFAQGDKESRETKNMFHGGNTTSHMEGQSFATKDSAFGNKVSHDGDAKFHGEGDTFKTRNDSVATRSAESPKDPGKIGNNANKLYSEDEIQKILNKN